MTTEAALALVKKHPRPRVLAGVVGVASLVGLEVSQIRGGRGEGGCTTEALLTGVGHLWLGQGGAGGVAVGPNSGPWAWGVARALGRFGEAGARHVQGWTVVGAS